MLYIHNAFRNRKIIVSTLIVSQFSQVGKLISTIVTYINWTSSANEFWLLDSALNIPFNFNTSAVLTLSFFNFGKVIAAPGTVSLGLGSYI